MLNHTRVVFAVLILCSLALVPPAQAQNDGCKAVRLLLQANLDFTRPIPYIFWSGKVRGFLGTEAMDGVLYGAGPTYAGMPSTIGTGQTGHEDKVSLVFDFGVKGRFLTAPDKGIFPLSPSISPHMEYPPPSAYSKYFYTAKVEPFAKDPLALPWQESTGMFVKATGSINLNGVFLVNAPPPADMGIWNAEITGRLCNLSQ